MSAPVLEIDGLNVDYPLASGSMVAAVRNFDLVLAAGEIHALVGESGAGKTTVGNALIGLLQAPGRISAGTIRIGGRDVYPVGAGGSSIVPGRDVGAIFQDPMTSLNPLFTIEDQLCEGMRYHLRLDRDTAKAKALQLLRDVGIPEPERRLKAYPHQLSGGQRQRVVIATALSCEPGLIVADEPTTALDVSVQAQILRLIRKLATDRGVGILLITHNMGVVAEIADRVTIMRGGEIVESGTARQVLTAPTDPYARSLIAAVPPLNVKLERFAVSTGEAPAAAAARETLRGKMRSVEQRSTDDLLRAEHVVVEYGKGLFSGLADRTFRAIDDISFAIRPGEIFGLVGESGCGKTSLANAIAGLAPISGGTMTFTGAPMTARRPRAMHKSLQMVFQDPYSALNPRIRIGDAIAEPIAFYRLAASRGAASGDADLLLEAVGLDQQMGQRFPHAFSGGQRQRIAIARALGPRPSLLICDEPTSSLDVSVQAQILNLLKDLRDLMNLSILFISHDLAVIRQMCDRVAVMRAGKIVELQDADALFQSPAHAYTRELLSMVPSIDKGVLR